MHSCTIQHGQTQGVGKEETLVTPRKLLVRLLGPDRFLFFAVWASVSASWSDIAGRIVGDRYQGDFEPALSINRPASLVTRRRSPRGNLHSLHGKTRHFGPMVPLMMLTILEIVRRPCCTNWSVVSREGVQIWLRALDAREHCIMARYGHFAIHCRRSCLPFKDSAFPRTG